MIRRQGGFTLVELMITMVIFVFTLAAASQVFTALLTQFKQQSKIAETNIEGIVGLEMMRRDIEHAGYGLPWNGLVNYAESAANPFGLNDAPAGAPRAVRSQNNVTTYASPNNIFNGSDYLVIKSVSVAVNEVSKKWTYVTAANLKTTWTPDCENVNKTPGCTTDNNVRVIVLQPGTTDADSKTLVNNGGVFFTTYGNTAAFVPTGNNVDIPNMIYGVDPDTDLRMPFNRADYYIWRATTSTATDEVPDRCAVNTGVLRKAVLNHSAGTFAGGIYPLLDCVADMQVIYELDTNADGVIDTPTNDISALSAADIRTQLKEIRIYILAHEGQRDANFTFSGFSDTDGDGDPDPPIIRVGESTALGALLAGRDLNISVIPDYLNYRWKVYTLVVRPTNLR